MRHRLGVDVGHFVFIDDADLPIADFLRDDAPIFISPCQHFRPIFSGLSMPPGLSLSLRRCRWGFSAFFFSMLILAADDILMPPLILV